MCCVLCEGVCEGGVCWWLPGVSVDPQAQCLVGQSPEHWLAYGRLGCWLSPLCHQGTWQPSSCCARTATVGSQQRRQHWQQQQLCSSLWCVAAACVQPRRSAVDPVSAPSLQPQPARQPAPAAAVLKESLAQHAHEVRQRTTDTHVCLPVLLVGFVCGGRSSCMCVRVGALVLMLVCAAWGAERV